MQIIFQQNFRRLEKIFGKNWNKISHIVLKNPPFMNLHFEHLGNNHFAIAHYFEQNGDLVSDPDMEIRFHPKQKMVEAISFQDGFSYERVYPYPGDYNRFNVLSRHKLNRFLAFWLNNIIAQGFGLVAPQPSMRL